MAATRSVLAIKETGMPNQNGFQVGRGVYFK